MGGGGGIGVPVIYLLHCKPMLSNIKRHSTDVLWYVASEGLRWKGQGQWSTLNQELKIKQHLLYFTLSDIRRSMHINIDSSRLEQKRSEVKGQGHSERFKQSFFKERKLFENNFSFQDINSHFQAPKMPIMGQKVTSRSMVFKLYSLL